LTATSETRTWDAIVSTSYDAYQEQLVDNIFKSNVLWYELERHGMIVPVDGGVQIIEHLMYGKNTTVSSYSGYDVIDTTPMEGITAAIFPWAEVAGSVTISRKQRRQNSGKHQIIDLVDAKIMQLEMSFKEKVNEYCFGTGKYNTSQSTDDPAGLRALVPTVPNNFDVGGVDTSVDTWWSSKVTGNDGTTLTWTQDTGDTPTSATGIDAINRTLNNTGKRAGGPATVIIGNQGFFESYQKSVTSVARVPANKQAADLGFPNLGHGGATIYWDDNFASAGVTSAALRLSKPAAYFLHPKFIKFKYDKESLFSRTPFVSPVNQTADTSLVVLMGNMCISARDKHGLLEDTNLTEIN
jgi:hypothetical protein